MALIPENVIDEILSRIDIVELISGYVTLKRAGRSYRALCPFHHEKTPSFMINPERQIFHCFGCGAGGNAFGFLMQYERLEFPEAVELLAKKSGVVLPRQHPGQQQLQNQNTQLYSINELAANFYFNQLNSAPGRPALDYLNKRGITRETIQKFKLGYAPQSWDGLLNYLRNKNLGLGLIEKTGLIVPRDGGGYYDRFRGRIIIPIIDARNRVIAFGARVMPNPGKAEGNDTLPKYINSPETPIYSKGKVLFGLNAAGEAIRLNDLAIIVEGYFDLLLPYQEGIKNITASCGTALTIEQLRLLKRYSQNVVMIYDSDNAGQMATLRSLELLIEEGMDVRIVDLPDGHDPDSYLRGFGSSKFQELVNQAKDVFDYKVDALKARYSPLTMANKAKIAAEMLPLLSKFNNMVLRSGYIKKLAEGLRVDENSLCLELKKVKDAHPSLRQSNPQAAPFQPLLNSYPTERMLVKLILEEEGMVSHLREKLAPSDFQDRDLSRIVSRIFELFCEGKKIDARSLLNHFAGSQTSKIICELTTCEGPKIIDRVQLLNDCIKRMKEDLRKLKQQELCEQIKLAEVRKDENRLKGLLEDFHCLTQKGSLNEKEGAE